MFCYKNFGQISYISPLERETLFSIMRNSLLLVVLLIVSQIGTVNAQDLFEAPDTVCVNQYIQLESNFPDKQSHYWGFCSAYMLDTPAGSNNMGANFMFDDPADIVMARNDDGNYFAFVANIGADTNGPSFVRLEFGNSLDNTPTVTSFGDMDGILPGEITSMYLVKDQDKGNWHIFLTAGNTISKSTLGRIDFGKSLGNTPNIVTFGNVANQMAYPDGIFVAKEADKWYGFFLNRLTNEIKRLDMDTNISLTPSVTDVNIAGDTLSVPTDIAAIIDNQNWYFFITNSGDSTITRLDMMGLSNTSPQASNVSANLSVVFENPSSITLTRDCDRIYAFVTSLSTHAVVRISMESVTGPYTSTSYTGPVVGAPLGPIGISRFLRDRDNVFSFIANRANNTLSKLKFSQCPNTDITFSLTNTPPEYKYTSPGLYNIYYAINEGLPDMQMQCKLIQVMPTPPIIMSDDTTICEGDTARFEIVSINAISYSWTPNYNISNTSKEVVKVWPKYTTAYTVRIPFPIGSCIVDTTLNVEVLKVHADAGPDRTIADGASTTLGGPFTIKGEHYLRVWSPRQYIDDIYSENPNVRPPHDFTYYLTVSDTTNDSAGVCTSVDTVRIYVNCEEINLPNAFMPERGGVRATFGLANQQLVKLSKFNIYDRWGKLVFTTTDATNEWDGTINGEKAAMGVYVYEVDGFCSSGRRIRKEGNVTLIR